MAYKSLARSFNFQIALVALSGAVMVGTIALGWWGVAPVAAIGIVYGLARMKFLYVRNMRKLAFMLDAIDNNDYAFKYRTTGHSQQDELVNETLNRITQILFQAKADAVQREKYYELILNSVGTGIVVVDDRGTVYQHNNAALHLRGLSIFTHVNQLEKIDERLMSTIKHIQPGEKQQVSFSNERGAVHLSLRVSEMTLQDKHVRIITLNDINNELDAKELDSWMRLTRVLTHEIMNSVTPITSLSDTLLSIHENVNPEIRDGLEVISSTGKSLIAFVESYRKFTHIPTPQPTLFYVRKLAHMTEYCILAITISLPLYVYGLRGFPLLLLAGIICVGFAATDEYHQSMVANRGPSITDVGIDSIGALIGITLVRLFSWIALGGDTRRRRRRRRR